MVSVKIFIRSNSRSSKECNIQLRLIDGRKFQMYVKTPLTVIPADWDPKTERLKSRALIDRNERLAFDDAVEAYRRALEDVYLDMPDKTSLTPELALELIEKKVHPVRTTGSSPNINKVSRIRAVTNIAKSSEQHDGESTNNKGMDIYSAIDRYLEEKQYPYTHYKTFITLRNILKRYELYKQIYTKRSYKITFDGVNEDFLLGFRDFIFNEHLLAGNKRYMKIYKEDDQKHNNKILVPRGHNTMVRYLIRLRTFWKWVLKKKLTTNDPFQEFTIGSTHDGNPYYITIDERDKLYHTDIENIWYSMTDKEKHEVCPYGRSEVTLRRLIRMRDIFVFQCMVGCRVGDLVNFTPANLSSNVLVYYPHKTKNNSNSFEVSVPLNQTAQEIVDKYRDTWQKTGKLFPFQSPQKYNRDLKVIFTLCGITRRVPVLNPLTSEYEQRPLNEVASSHMARRTFIGNLYKKVKDPNLIGKLSGHVEGSKAFCRYRNIDMDMKRDLVNMLE